jgi:hypothetical protein
MTDTRLTTEVAASQEHWRAGRRYLNEHRHELSQWAARNLYAGYRQVGESGLMTREEWMPANPIPLENVTLSWCEKTPVPELDGSEPETAGVRPLQQDGRRYATYAQALGDLARPRLYDDRLCYRLVDVDFDSERAQLAFGIGTYFDVMNVCEATAHELADAERSAADDSGIRGELPFRSLVVDPCDLNRRPMLPAISALTVRRSENGPTVVLHSRDSTKVAHGGGLHQVMPVGTFQPSAAPEWNLANDFDLWRCIVREYSEEFLGADERQGVDEPIDYDGWAFYRTLTDARAAGDLSVQLVGIGVDPLSLVMDLLVIAVFNADAFDHVFSSAIATNAEGRVYGRLPRDRGIATVPLEAEPPKMQAAGAALLQLAAASHRRL